MSFNFSDLAGPLAVRYNDNVRKFIETVKKHIGFDEDTDIILFSRDRNDFIDRVILRRNFSQKEKRGKVITFIPDIRGHFDVIYDDLALETTVERKDRTELGFFAFSLSEGHIEEAKDFFK